MNFDFESFKVQSKQGKVFEVVEIERIESTERKLKALYARFDAFERLSSRNRPGNGDTDGVGSEQQENGQKQEVYI